MPGALPVMEVDPERRSEPAAEPWLLLAEDDADLRQLLAMTITEITGVVVKAAADGREALELLAQGSPSAVLTDLMMPAVDGYRLLEALRRELPDLPVLAMSAADWRSQALEAGFDGFIAKPFELDELLVLLDGILTSG